MNKRLLLIVILIFLIFFSIFYFFPRFLLVLELKICNSLFYSAKILNRASTHLNEIVIVALDDSSFEKMQKKWPFSRGIYAEFLKKVNKGNPRLIIFDIVFGGEGEDRKGDDSLAEELKGRGNILLPYHIGRLGEHIKSKKDFLVEFGSAGYINKPLDYDGIIRRFLPFRLSVEGKILDYTAELYLFSRYYNYNLKDITLKDKCVFFKRLENKNKNIFERFKFSLDRDDSLLINYQATMDDFNVLPMWQVLSDDFVSDIFTDKIVFVGETANIFHDVYGTPLGLMPGTAILANAALMFLDGRFIYEMPEWFNWLIIFVFCLFMTWFFYRLSILKGLFLAIAIITIVITTSFMLFLKSYYFNPFKLILICLIDYIVINFFKYAYVVIENIQLRRISTTDELTGLHTFRFFQVVLNHEFQKYLRYKTPLSLLMMDIDNFKKINDTYGHQVGNIVLKGIGKIILNNIRQADFPARYGGEEIAILLPNSNIDGAYKCAENLRRLIEKQNFPITKEGNLNATVSIGVASFLQIKASSSDEIIKLADTALYSAKKQGKNKTVIFKQET